MKNHNKRFRTIIFLICLLQVSIASGVATDYETEQFVIGAINGHLPTVKRYIAKHHSFGLDVNSLRNALLYSPQFIVDYILYDEDLGQYAILTLPQEMEFLLYKYAYFGSAAIVKRILDLSEHYTGYRSISDAVLEKVFEYSKPSVQTLLIERKISKGCKTRVKKMTNFEIEAMVEQYKIQKLLFDSDMEIKLISAAAHGKLKAMVDLVEKNKLTEEKRSMVEEACSMALKTANNPFCVAYLSLVLKNDESERILRNALKKYDPKDVKILLASKVGDQVKEVLEEGSFYTKFCRFCGLCAATATSVLLYYTCCYNPA